MRPSAPMSNEGNAVRLVWDAVAYEWEWLRRALAYADILRRRGDDMLAHNSITRSSARGWSPNGTPRPTRPSRDPGFEHAPIRSRLLRRSGSIRCA